MGYGQPSPLFPVLECGTFLYQVIFILVFIFLVVDSHSCPFPIYALDVLA
jgi:hypothetical protein